MLTRAVMFSLKAETEKAAAAEEAASAELRRPDDAGYRQRRGAAQKAQEVF